MTRSRRRAGSYRPIHDQMRGRWEPALRKVERSEPPENCELGASVPRSLVFGWTVAEAAKAFGQQLGTASRSVVVLIVLLPFALSMARVSLSAERPKLPKLTEITVTSRLDGSRQPALLWAPESAKTKTTPMLVFLHSWSSNYKQNNWPWHEQAVKRGWIYLHPNFRGRNDQPEACGSELARRDVLDSIDFVVANFQVDTTRLYLAGASGGGHMAMLMAGYHPDRFSAVSSWVGISDLAEWYRFHVKDGKPQNYARMVLACCGGPPGQSDALDAQYRDRSPLFHMHRVGDLPLDLCAGIRDGYTGSVPIQHTLKAFNVVAKSVGADPVSPEEMNALSEKGRSMAKEPVAPNAETVFGRQIYLQRFAGNTRVTIFDGGHEGLAGPACEWFAKHKRQTHGIEPSSPH